MNLSPHFTLDEFVVSQTAIRHGIDNTPSESIIENLKHLCLNCLEPLRDKLKKSIFISSGYRCQQLNGLIGGAKNSQHITGHAADISVKGMNVELLFQTIIESKLVFDQLIQEFDSWVHISFDINYNRNNILRAKKVNGKTIYLEEKN